MANEPQKKPFTWDSFDAQPTGANKPFVWGDEGQAQQTRSPEVMAASKARNAQPTQFEKQNTMSPSERQANEFLLGAASGASGLPETLHPIKDAAQPPQTVAQSLRQGLAAATPGAGLISSLYHAGKQIISPPTAEDPTEQRSHGLGTLAGLAGSAMVGEGVNNAVGGTQAAARNQLFTPEGMKTPLGEALSNPTHKLPEYGLRKLVGAPEPEVKGSSVPVRQSPAFNAAEYNAGRKGVSIAPPSSTSPSEGGIAAPQADVIKVPEPRELFPGEKVGYNASTPRRLLLDNALQGRPGAAEMLRNAGKTPLYVPESGYAPPKERITLGAPTPERSQITLNPIGAKGARPLVPENQFESSFGPEHQEVGDLAEWETGSREGVRPKKVLVP